MSSLQKKRNENVDILRGIAMLLVVLGHTMTGCTEGSQDSFLFQVIWSLQMPLFILISGYVTRYSKTINTISDLGKLLWKRTVAYLLPWCSWSFLVRGLIFQQSNYLNIKWLLWHMDSGYWFLFTLWTIVVVFSISQFIANKICKDNIKAVFVIKTIAYLCGMGLLVGIGSVFGMAFLAIKLTLYYMPFYYAGHIYGVIQDKIFALKKGEYVIEVISALCLVLWLIIITRVNLYYAEDGGMPLLIRATASLSGCIAICSLMGNNELPDRINKFLMGGRERFYGNLRDSLSSSKSLTISCKTNGAICPRSCYCCNQFYDNSSAFGTDSSSYQHKKNPSIMASRENGMKAVFIWIGNNSLQIYLLHGFFLNLLSMNTKPEFSSVEGASLFFVNYLITILCVVVVIKGLNRNRVISMLLFGKKVVKN